MIAARQGDGRFGPSQWEHEHRTRALAAAVNADGTQLLDPTPWVGGVRPFLMQELLAVPHRRPQRAHQYRVREGLQRGQGARLGEQHGPHTRADAQRRVLAERRGARPCCGTMSPATWSRTRATASISMTAPSCSAMLNLSRRGCGDQLLERQVLLRLLAAVAGDPRGGQGRQPQDRARQLMDAAPHRPVSRAPSGHLCLDGAHLPVLRSFFGRDKIRSASRAASSVARRASSTGSRNLSRRSSRRASGRACTSAPPMCRRRNSARTSLSSWRRTTSSRSTRSTTSRRSTTDSWVAAGRFERPAAHRPPPGTRQPGGRRRASRSLLLFAHKASLSTRTQRHRSGRGTWRPVC